MTYWCHVPVIAFPLFPVWFSFPSVWRPVSIFVSVLSFFVGDEIGVSATVIFQLQVDFVHLMGFRVPQQGIDVVAASECHLLVSNACVQGFP